MTEEQSLVAEAIRAALHPSDREVVEVVAVRRRVGVASVALLRSADADVDPVGAVVGLGGHRIREVIATLPAGETISLFESARDPMATAHRVVLQALRDEATGRPLTGAVCLDPDRRHVDVVLAIGAEAPSDSMATILALGLDLLGFTVTVHPADWEPDDADQRRM